MVDYNNFAKSFSHSRKNMKWEEIYYFFDQINADSSLLRILDIWCWSGRLLEQFSQKFDISNIQYIWLDLSENMLDCARESFPEKEFLNLNMLELDKIQDKKFNYIFFIASFHHLQSVKEREEVLQKTYNLLENWGRIYMTNWALNSEVNDEKYGKSIIQDSKNKHWSTDYNIVFWENDRYYHCFDLKELEYLAKKFGFKIIENRLFDSQKNFITILEK